jgi:hypothetical protein
MSNIIHNNYFLLLLVFITIPLNETNPNKEAQVCHLEIYTESRDLLEQKPEKPFVNVQATLLSDKPDCSVILILNLAYKN